MAKFDFIIGDDGRAKPVIPVTVFPTTEEEKAAMIEAAKRRTLRLIEWHPIEIRDGEIIGELPEDGQTVLVSVIYARGVQGVTVDVFCEDQDGSFFEDWDWPQIKAWAPMPEPYKPKREEGTT